ncbi:MAG: hypothetical protein ABSD89_12220 [Halobacteriota archaeon]|jgi:hypothetical protein
MNCTVKAVLARFGGDKRAAIDYCVDLARANPKLADEYWHILDMIRGGESYA